MPAGYHRNVDAAPIAKRLAELDWSALERSLWDHGFAQTPAVLSADECETLVELYDDDTRFRSRVDMARYRFGDGDYKYLAHPLPPVVGSLREEAYPRLARLANAWEETLGSETRYPPDLAGLLAVCRRHGQTKPTPLLLHYEAGGYNCLHQDLYGDIAFPLQITAFLSRRGVDYEGGDFLLVEQRPRAQSRGEAIHTERGELVIFPTRHRPVRGARGWHRTTMRHGVSTITRGTRYTLGIIFHDAK
jgi:uncharacterized protein